MVLDNLSYCRAYTHEHQMALLTLACARMVSQSTGCRCDARQAISGEDPSTALSQAFAATQLVAAQIEERIALVIVDSAMALFRVDFTGRGQLAERQNKSAERSRLGL